MVSIKEAIATKHMKSRVPSTSEEVEPVTKRLVWILVNGLANQEGQLVSILTRSRHSYSTLQELENMKRVQYVKILTTLIT